MLNTKKQAAVFTICRNESFFLPLWMNYYKKHFDEKDIYVLDHQSTDGSTEFIPNRIIVENSLTQDNNWLIDVTYNFQKELLKKYNYVLFTNADEIVVPTTATNIKEYTKTLNADEVRCTGYEVLHMMDEPPYNPSKKVLEQRHFWYANPQAYNKPLLSRIETSWTGGWHNTTNTTPNVDPNLYLIHLHRMDYNKCLERHKKTSSEPIYQPDLEKKWGWHHTIYQNEEFAKWFYCIEAAKILNAEKSLAIYNKNKNIPLEEIYATANSIINVIPPEFISHI